MGSKGDLNGNVGTQASLAVVQDPATPLTLDARAGTTLAGQVVGGLYLFPGSDVVPRQPRGSEEDRVAFPISNLRPFGLPRR